MTHLTSYQQLDFKSNKQRGLLKYIIYIFFFCLISTTLGAQKGYFKVTPQIRTAYHFATSLRFDEANLVIDSIKTNDPNNLLVLHIENYVDFFRVFINEDKDEFDRLIDNKDDRLDMIEKYGDRSSPYYLFVQAEIELQWAVARAKFKELLKAGSGSLSAYRMLKKNQSLFPDFIANKKSLSAIHALAETVPGIIKLIFSVDGSISQGIAEIEEVIKYSDENDFLYRDEAVAIYTYIMFFQNNQRQKAWSYLQDSGLDPATNPLACFLIASIAQKTSNNETAIKILESRARSSNYAPFHYLDFMEGKSKLYRLDTDSDILIKRFIDNFKGRHYIKEAYQKLSWYELVINENYPAYRYYLEKCKKHGYDLIDEDKQALKEAKQKLVPNVELLRSRLLFDGGYMQKSYQNLIKKAYLLENDPEHQLEYYYRLGRVSQSLQNAFDAIFYYGMVLQKGTKSKSYYPCSSALYMGLIYESQALYNEAKISYKNCLNLDPDEYSNSLHQKAKSGLQRIDKYID